MADIFTEVDEDLRRDRAERLWKKYGKYVLALAVVIVAATAGWVWWTDQQRRQAAAEGERFFAALSQTEGASSSTAANAVGAVARDAKSGFRVIALLHEAGFKARAGEAEAALAIYRAVAADMTADPDLRDAATLLGAMVAVENLPRAEIDAMLAGISNDRSAWRFSAFDVGATAALRAGDRARARELYTRIADDAAAPPSLRARAAELLQALGE